MLAMTNDFPVSFSDVESAADRLRGIAHRTPVMTSRRIDQLCGATVFFKCENFQRVGAFKFRGAYNALSRLSPEQRERGVLTYSSGNHAQAVALAASLLGMRSTIIMPFDAPAVKLEATRGYGGEVVTFDRDETSRERLAAEMTAERGMTVIPPYDHKDVIAGQGTAAMELIDEVRDRDGGGLDALFVCVGGGGILSGSAVAVRAMLGEACLLVGVEPENADDAVRSFETGTIQTVHNPDTIADGARTPSLGKLTFAIIRGLVNEMLTVSDDELIAAMRLCWGYMKIVVEPTAVLSLAGLLRGKLDMRGKRVGVILTGGNVDLASAAQLLAAPNPVASD
jgi:threonine dehydratase